ncbi:MAG TPA: alpha/beta hydrolase [Polyangiaceae bacterium]|nr:alpha/beta hydrolase [Polyangiaceae bacterium]
MPAAPTVFRSKILSRRKRWFIAFAGVLLAAGVYFWPARRNYFGKLGDLDVRLDVPYVPESRDPKQQLDLYLPQARLRPFPMVVFVHGGYWKPLDRRWLQSLLGTHGNVGAALARRGIGAAIVGYRQYPQVQKGDDSIDDIARAIRYVQSEARSWGGDPKRLIVMGHSAGGHLVSLLGMDPDILRRHDVESGAVAGFVSIDGVFDLSAALGYLKPDQVSILRGLFGPDDAALAQHSTITHARADHAPMLFVDSTDDEAVCLDGFHRMRARLAHAGSKALFVELKGLGHNEMIVRVGTDNDPLMPTLLEFIETVPAR